MRAAFYTSKRPSAAVTGSVWPAGWRESSVGLFWGSKRGPGGVPFVVGFPVAANAMTYAVGSRLCVCRLEQLDHRAANEDLAADHIRAFDVKPTHLLANELQREVV
jgi:hypothetical protein